MESWTIFGTAFGGLGVLLAIVFYVRSKRTGRLAFDIRSVGLLDDATTSLPGFSAALEGEALPRLTALRIVVWNQGSDRIDSCDIASTDPIRFRLPDRSRIVAASVTQLSDRSNMAAIELRAPDEVQLQFEYFAPRQGCILSLLHTGQESLVPQALGTVKGGGHVRRFSRAAMRRWSLSYFVYISPFLAVCVVLLAIGAPEAWYSYAALFGVLALTLFVPDPFRERFFARGTSDLDKDFRAEFTAASFSSPAAGSQLPREW